MRLDLDLLEMESMTCGAGGPFVSSDDLAALVRIARAAVAWRAETPQCVDEPFESERALLDALREAGV